jgi:hypothetical protein
MLDGDRAHLHRLGGAMIAVDDGCHHKMSPIRPNAAVLGFIQNVRLS